MRCHYMSDLHLEAQDVEIDLPEGDVLIVAGDLCNAKFIEPDRSDIFSKNQRDRVMHFLDQAREKFRNILFVTGNHEHFEYIFEDTIPMLRSQLSAVTILENEHVDIEGVRFYGCTLWSDFLGGSKQCMDIVKRRMGEFLLVKKWGQDENANQKLIKFQPEHALAEFNRSLNELKKIREDGFQGQAVIITHHAPSPQSLSPYYERDEMDGAFMTDLTSVIENLEDVPFWVHGHTHIQKKYRIGSTQILTNCLGLISRDQTSRGFSANRWFELG